MNIKKHTEKEKQIAQMNREYSINRLINAQNVNISYVIEVLSSNDIFDKNDVYNILNEILIQNVVLDIKLQSLLNNEKK